MRQLAWLNTAPVVETKGKRQDQPKRLDRFKAQKIEPALPENPASYLTDWLFDIGPTVPAGMSSAAIGYQDIAAFQSITGVEMMPWEAKLLRRLSGDFLAQLDRSKKPDCPAPYVPHDIAVRNDEAVGEQFRSWMETIQKTKSKPKPKSNAKLMRGQGKTKATSRSAAS